MPFSRLSGKSELLTLLPFGHARSRERALSILRLVAALGFTALFPLIANQAGDYSSAFQVVLLGYLLSSSIILALVFFSAAINRTFLAIVQASDLIWPALICLITGCANSPFFLLFVFALLHSLYRRKWAGTVRIAFCCVLILVAEPLLLSFTGLQQLHLLRSPIHLGAIAVEAGIFAIIAGALSCLAFWAEREQQAYVIRQVLRRLRSDASIQANLRETLPAILEAFDARKAVLVLRSSTEGRIFQWVANSETQNSNRSHSIHSTDENWLWELPQSIWSIACSRSGSRRNYLALNRYGYQVPVEDASLRIGSLMGHPFHSLLITNLEFGNEWSGQLFIVDAPCAAGVESCLRLLQQLGDEVGPATYNFHLWRHASLRVREIERQQLARDLHDGVVQSLITAEVQLEILRRKSPQDYERSVYPDVLPDVQSILRMEVRKLRHQIEQLRSSAFSGPFLPLLREMVEGFRRETGIKTKLSCDVQEGSAPNRISAEVLHILEEALSNIRRHSGAQEVEIRITSQENAWEILVQDDGCGFDFSGRFSLPQLEAAKIGPKVIRERVHSAKGDLVVESYPKRGSRLKIRLVANK